MESWSDIKLYCWISKIVNLGAQLLWHVLHFLVSIWYCLSRITDLLGSYVIECGILKRYKSLDLGKLRYLAVVVDSEEGHHTSEVIELLHWLEVIGVKYVCLYDMEGVLKKSKEKIIEKLSNGTVSKVEDGNKKLFNQEKMTLEFCSFSDGKEAMAKAANVLLIKYDQEKLRFTEPEMAKALTSIGFGFPDPDLLLVYGPARCHLGFPAWRLRYTEIVHMGPLRSRRYGSLVKAIYDFTMVRQNFGK